MNDLTPDTPAAGTPSEIAAPETLSENTVTEPVAIDVRDLDHSFKNHQALNQVNFQVKPRSLHGFVGPNGAGKTTALKLVCTLLRPQSGSVRVFGRDVLTDTKAVRRQIGFMPDHFSMYRQMTVTEYLDFFAAAYGLAWPTAAG